MMQAEDPMGDEVIVVAASDADRKFIRALADRVRGGNCVLLLGPGVAVDPRAADRPLLGTLLAQLLAGDPEVQGRCPPEMQGNLRHVAQLYFQAKRSETLHITGYIFRFGAFPRPNTIRTKFEPINPAPPVTKSFIRSPPSWQRLCYQRPFCSHPFLRPGCLREATTQTFLRRSTSHPARRRSGDFLRCKNY